LRKRSIDTREEIVFRERIWEHSDRAVGDQDRAVTYLALLDQGPRSDEL
jgi:hypothetical protein